MRVVFAEVTGITGERSSGRPDEQNRRFWGRTGVLNRKTRAYTARVGAFGATAGALGACGSVSMALRNVVRPVVDRGKDKKEPPAAACRRPPLRQTRSGHAFDGAR